MPKNTINYKMSLSGKTECKQKTIIINTFSNSEINLERPDKAKTLKP